MKINKIRIEVTDSVDFVAEFTYSPLDKENGLTTYDGWVLTDTYCLVGDGDEIDSDLIDFLQPDVVDRLTEEAIDEMKG